MQRIWTKLLTTYLSNFYSILNHRLNIYYANLLIKIRFYITTIFFLSNLLTDNIQQKNKKTITIYS